VNQVLEQLKVLSDVGFTIAHGSCLNVSSITPIEIIGERIVPVIADW
jgi:hypothetical protein